jgi:hypothetical protein
MGGWRWAWARAQTPAWLVSAYVALVLLAIAPPALPAAIVLGAAAVWRWNSKPLMWLRYGARPADAGAAVRFLTLLVPIRSMRGRGQPRVWVSERLVGADCVMSGERDLVVSRRLLRWAMSGEVSQERVCAVAAHAKGLAGVWGSRLASASWVLAGPWRVIQAVADVARGLVRGALARFVWRWRWVVGGVAVVQTAWSGRWIVAGLVAGLVVLTWAVPRWNHALRHRLAVIGDRQAVAEGFGEELIAVLRARGESADQARVSELVRLVGESPTAEPPQIAK